jgi:hypothetical protein
MKVFISVVICFLLSFKILGQTFQFDKIPLAKIDSIEKLNGSDRFIYDYPIGVSSDYFPNRVKYNLAQPIVYRKNHNNYFLETSYYFSAADNSLRLIEYWWRDTTYSLDYTDTIISKNYRIISAFLKSKGKNYPENKNHGEKTIWRNKLYYIQQFPVAEGIRVLISWN